MSSPYRVYPRPKVSIILEQLMEASPVTQSSLAEHTGVSQPTICRILGGFIPTPKLTTLQPLARYFGVTVGQMIGDEPLAESRVHRLVRTPTRPVEFISVR